MTDKDRSVVRDASFLPFGEDESLIGSAANDNRFPGQRLSSEAGLHYNYVPDYDPTTGRYLQSDPIGLAGGINIYGYVSGNPVMYTDLKGESAVVATLSLAGGPLPIDDMLLGGVLVYDILYNVNSDEEAGQCPPGSKPIDLEIIKRLSVELVQAQRIIPKSTLLGMYEGENPDGSWTNDGPACDYTGSGRPSGRSGKDRKRRR